MSKSGKETFSKKIQGRLKKGLPKKISATISSGLNSKLGTKLNESAQLASRVATQTAVQTAQIATETAHMAAERVQNVADAAKQSLDQVLIGLEHRGIKIKDSGDIAQKIGRKVLERAEGIRAQLAANPFAPDWLKTTAKDCKPMSQETTVKATEPEKPLRPEHEVDMAADDVGVDVDSAPPVKKARRTASSGRGKGASSARLNK